MSAPAPSLACPRCQQDATKELTAAEVAALVATGSFACRPGDRVFRCTPCRVVYSVFTAQLAEPANTGDAGQSNDLSSKDPQP